MKLLLRIFILSIFSHQAYGQKTQDLDGMSTYEIRKLIITQTVSDEAREMIIKHNRARKTSYGFLGASFILKIISNNSINPEQDNKDSISAAVGAASCGIIALACGISAHDRMRKAKEIYQVKISESAFDKSFIRSETGNLNLAGN